MPADRGYMPQLDGLRAIAVATVLVFHWFKPPFALAQWGVTLFFVLSGYLITRNIAALKASGMPVASAARVFFVQRTLRLFPAYYLVLLLGVLLYDDIRRDWAWYAAYLSNVLMDLRSHFSAFKASWSLSVEEQFYVVWFFVVMWVPAQWLPRIILLAFVAEPLVRCAWLAPEHPAFRTWTLWANCSGLALGAYLAHLEVAGRELPVSRKGAVVVLAAAFAALAAFVPPQSPAYGPPASVLVSTICAWVVWHARKPWPGIAGGILSHPAVVHVGRVSYGVYLYHTIVPGVAHAMGLEHLPGVWRLFAAGSVIGFVAHCAIVVGVATLSFRWFEMPIRDLARARRRATTAASA
jgi:peptidoglycan/LPS O-acetylase OafA/YrhL